LRPISALKASTALLAFAADLAILPGRRIATKINDSKDKDVDSVDSVEDAIGTSARDSAADLPVDDLALHQVPANTIDKRVDLLYTHTAEAAALALIPSGGRPDVRPWLAAGQRVGRSQLTENIVPCRLPGLDIGGCLVVLSDPFVQKAAFGLPQRLLLDLSCDFVPEFLDEPGSLVDRQFPERLSDLVSIHLHVTSGHTVLPTIGEIHPDTFGPMRGAAFL
jgi:hypothetical protein